MAFNIVLVEPEIPQNTGNIARTCAATGSRLHLVRPLGFAVTDRHLKRAGLDYWQDVEVIFHDSLRAFLEAHSPASVRLCLATTKAPRLHSEFAFLDETYILFGKETAGLPQALLDAHPEAAVRIPMRPGTRSLNLSNAAAVILYEALRQSSFRGLR